MCSEANKDPGDDIWRGHGDIWFPIRDVTHFQRDRLAVSISAAVALAVLLAAPLTRCQPSDGFWSLSSLPRASWLDLIWLWEALITRWQNLCGVHDGWKRRRRKTSSAAISKNGGGVRRVKTVKTATNIIKFIYPECSPCYGTTHSLETLKPGKIANLKEQCVIYRALWCPWGELQLLWKH